MWTDLRFRLRALFRRRRADQDLDDELRFHRDGKIAQYIRDGLSPADAERRVTLEVGAIPQLQEDCRDARGVGLAEDFLRDIRYALRSLRKSPGFTAIAASTLALGVGANTAIFSVVYDALLRPLPYRDASQLVVLNETTPRVGMVSVSYPNFLDWRAQNHVFSDMSVVGSLGANLAGASQPEDVAMEMVSANYFTMIGVHPALGRDFTPEEDRSGAAPVVVISHYLWQSHFGSDAHVVGHAITLDGKPFTIVGVLPAGFRSLDQNADVFQPIGVAMTGDDTFQARGERGDMLVVGRLAGGVSLDRARAEMESIAARLAATYPATNDQFGVALRPIRDVFVSDVRSALLILFGAATCVLLIACANVANLVLIRGAGRHREIALRLALGASRGRVVRQLLTESAVLACAGGVLGLGVAVVCVKGLSTLAGAALSLGSGSTLSVPLLLFTVTVAIVATLVVGVAPAMQGSKAGPQTALKDDGRTSSASRRQRRWRSALATAEVALALVLLVGAGLMMKSVSRLLAVDGGFRVDRVFTMSMELRGERYDQPAAVRGFWQSLVERVRAIPGVDEAAIGTGVPLTEDHSRSDINIEGMPPLQPGSFPHPDVHRVSSGYVHTLGIAVLRGRALSDDDTDQAPRVALINQTIATKYFPGQDPVGRRFAFGRSAPAQASNWITIVGVVADTKLYGLDNPSRLEVYLPYLQRSSPNMTVLVKSAMGVAAVTAALRRVVQGLDPDQPVTPVMSMSDLRAQSMSTRRSTLILLGVFSALAVVLAAIGIYGVMSYTVTLRTHELGVRLALGAGRTHVLGTILGQGMALAAVGIAVGLVAAFGVTRLMATLLFDVSAVDPAIFAGVTAGLVLVALAACYLPARRTLGVDPLIALRHE